MRYRVLRGINYPPGNQRAEAGQTVELSQTAARSLMRLEPPAVEPEEDDG